MATEDHITLVIEGLPEDDGQVRLAAFLSELQNLNATLNRLDRDANAGKTASYFRIAELSYNSPVRVTLGPHPLPGKPPTGLIVIDSLNRISAALASGGDLLDLDAELLGDLRNLARPVGATVKSATLLFDDSRIDLTPQIVSRVDAALAVDEECEGFLQGNLEQINLHLGVNTFQIYPDVGPKKVTCHFPARLYDEAVSAVGRKVEVFGTLLYRARTDFPHQIEVTSIEAYPPESDLPDWEDLRGRAPDATGGLSSEAFVRELRDGWR
ncbi:hypothetical protein NKH84_02325 [Mesorhizobium sp. M0902]|uniref:hypothetical protein n=1 Tax=unclassified Mesorhizobium TaxID=325217 RepID=UPI00333DEFF0